MIRDTLQQNDSRSEKLPESKGKRYALRGWITENGLADSHGTLASLGLTIEDIRDKKTLEVGTGGGKSFEEAITHFGLDYYGVDVLPGVSLYDPEWVEMQNRLMRRIAQYTERFQTADACVRIPHVDSSMDVVLSAKALPGYARSSKEYVTSVLEMIRVSKGLVAFNESMSDEGWVTFGKGDAYSFFFYNLFSRS
jgi:hypothetical protein